MGVLAFSCFLFAAIAQSVWAVPALNRYFTITQEDGTEIQVRNVGDEKFHYQETSDGRILTKGQFKHFTHHVDTSLVVKAREAKQSTPSLLRMPSIDPKLNNGEKKAIVLLVQFKDTKFSTQNPAEFYDRFLNEEGFSDYNSAGSVRDYFKFNSQDKFIPNFTVIGPITLAGNAGDYGPGSKYGDAGAAVAISEAIDSLVKQKTFNFAEYDQDKDGLVDFVHMIYAGAGANDTGNNNLIWPHMWYIPNGKRVAGNVWNGIYIQPYACTSELDGVAYSLRQKVPAGVGTFIHEFGHILGLPDMYSADETLHTASMWDVMDQGSYNCPKSYYSSGFPAFAGYPTSCSPANYSAFERISLGWMKAEALPIGNDTLHSVTQNKAYQVANPQNKDEIFLLEYRDQTGWDAGLPNHGMLIWHIDYKKSAWDSAAVNATAHQRVDIIEADGKANENTLATDVFPGTGKNKYTRFNSFITWNNTDLGFTLSDITESGDNTYVTFLASDGSLNLSSSYISSQSSSSLESSSSSEQSSSSEALSSSEQSSSSAVSSSSEQSSSSEAVFSSSSQVESSSSEAEGSSSLEESSSSETEDSTIVETMDSTDFAGCYKNWNRNSNHLSVFSHENTLFVTNLPQGEKSFRLFSLNGNVLYDTKTAIDQAEISLNFIRGPVILQITLGNRLIYSKRIR